MTNKQIATRLREAADNRDRPIRHIAREIANELDPARPEPGLIRFNDGQLGFVLRGRSSLTEPYDIVTEYGELLYFADAMPFKPARILEPDEVAVTIPNTGTKFETLMLKWHHVHDGRDYGTIDACVHLTSDDVERMEAER